MYKSGVHGGCPVLKLQRPAWTNDDMRQVPNESGLFLSIWLDEESVRRERLRYDVHALRLRSLRGFKLRGIAFARDFRRVFESHGHAWPNLSVDFGPRTLMQGWLALSPDRLERDALALLVAFAPVANKIDLLLASRCDPLE